MPVAVAGVQRRPRRAVLPLLPAEVTPVGMRVVALLADQVVALAVAIATLAVWVALDRPLPLWPVLGAALAALCVVQLVDEAVTGATLGSRLTGIRTVSGRTGLPAGLLAVGTRWLVLGAANVLPVLGPFAVTCSGAGDDSPARRGWHDKLAGTVVLQAWAVPSRTSPAAAARRRWAGAVTGPVAARGVVPHPSAASDRPVHTRYVAVAHASGQVPSGPAPWRPVTVTPTTVHPATAHPTTVRPVTAHPTVRPVTAHPVETPAVPSPRGAASAPGTAPLGEVELTRAVPLSAPATRRPRVRLRFDTGQEIVVAGDGAVGRDLSSLRPSPYHQVLVRDPARSVSRVHLRFGPQPDGMLWVVDDASTNGTVLVDPAGRASALPPGVRAVVGPGWQLRFGERSAVVEEAPELPPAA